MRPVGRYEPELSRIHPVLRLGRWTHLYQFDHAQGHEAPAKLRPSANLAQSGPPPRSAMCPECPEQKTSPLGYISGGAWLVQCVLPGCHAVSHALLV
jgi:hypothetical protein